MHKQQKLLIFALILKCFKSSPCFHIPQNIFTYDFIFLKHWMKKKKKHWMKVFFNRIIANLRVTELLHG